MPKRISSATPSKNRSLSRDSKSPSLKSPDSNATTPGTTERKSQCISKKTLQFLFNLFQFPYYRSYEFSLLQHFNCIFICEFKFKNSLTLYLDFYKTNSEIFTIIGSKYQLRSVDLHELVYQYYNELNMNLIRNPLIFFFF